MLKYFAAYLSTGLVMLLLDVVWLGFIAKPLYQQGIGHLMAEQPNLVIAALFYVVYAAGLMWFAVVPNANALNVSNVLMTAALFGFFAYATYDLTNWATLKNWSASVALADMFWGTVASACSAAAGYYVLRAMRAF